MTDAKDCRAKPNAIRTVGEPIRSWPPAVLRIAFALVVVGWGGISVSLLNAQEISPTPTTPRIDAIIASIEAAEALTEDVDLRLIEKYEYLAVPKVSTNWKQIVDEKRHVTYVHQDGRYRVEIDAGRKFSQGESVQEANEERWQRTRLFDGETSRALQGNVVNIAPGVTQEAGVIRPHMLLLRSMGYNVPLSVYLKGEAAMKARLGRAWNLNQTIHVKHLESEAIGDCEVIEVQLHSKSGTPIVGWKLWIASNRNYLPVKVHSFTYRYSKSIPVAEGAATDLREIEPGIWYPHRVQKTAFVKSAVAANGTQEPLWRRSYAVEKVSLNPDYDASYFSDLKIPEGAYVHRLDSKGEIVESFRHEVPSRQQEPLSR